MPGTISIAEPDRARVRSHMGYPSTEPTSSIQLGFPAAQQPAFLVERAMDRVMPDVMGRIFLILTALDSIEAQMVCALSRLKAQQLGELKIRNSNEEPTEQDLLEREYHRWAQRLSDALGAPLNPFSERFRGGGGASMSLPVAGEV